MYYALLIILYDLSTLGTFGFDFTCGLKTTSKRLATRYKLVYLVLSQHNFTGLMRPERSKQYCLQLLMLPALAGRALWLRRQ